MSPKPRPERAAAPLPPGPASRVRTRSDEDRAGPRSALEGDVVYLTSTEAKNAFGRVLDLVAHHRAVVITRHDDARAVVVSVDHYRELTRSRRSDLGRLTAEFDALVAAMQTPTARAAAEALERATPEDLGRAAVAAARRANP